MHQTMEIYMARKKKAPHHRFMNTYRVFNERVSGARTGLDTFIHGFKDKEQDGLGPAVQGSHNIPHPYYAKFLNSNVRFYNEPICYMETEATMHKQGHWWPSGLPSITLQKPPYDMKTTQRSDFVRIPYSLSARAQNKDPVTGIVPLATPRTASRLPKLLLEQISYQNNYDNRRFTNEPPRGKRHGAFVWREIKPSSGPTGPRGSKVFLSALGSCSHQEPNGEKGNRVENSMTSPTGCRQHSQQMFDSDAHLSKTDLSEAARAYPRIPASGQRGPRISQTPEADGMCPAEVDVCQPITGSPDKALCSRRVTSAARLPQLPPATSTCTEPSLDVTKSDTSPGSAKL
ncbi:ciliary microtubule inner protein 6 [Lissotriton helveticus]